jgi:hypothetical protein
VSKGKCYAGIILRPTVKVVVTVVVDAALMKHEQALLARTDPEHAER